MKVFEGLKFSRKTSIIHFLDPRTKFLVSCVIFLISLIFSELIILSILFVAQIPLILLAKIQREWSHSIRGGAFLIIIILSTNLIFGYISNNFQLTSRLLIHSIAMAFRFIIITSSFSIFFLTTSPDNLSLALEQSHIPYEFCFAFTTAVRFVPVLANEAQTIIDAQRSRGLEVEKGNFLKRVRKYIPLLIPLIVNAIRRSLELAEAMESRAFGAKKQRTNIYSLKIKKADSIIIISSLIIIFLAIYSKFNLQIPIIQIPLLPP
ncbi:MAG: energy-coupling factor transporter transmembrane protein EcfT [Candidatus Bathyarchaeota archaeon]|nr:MAG: energy-coupling factor transporter transmembrane protein EcfT [Candidatus Bathyarchaeota archaeon]